MSEALDYTPSDKARIGKVVADQIALKQAVNDMIAELSYIEESHEDDPAIQYTIGRAIGQLVTIYSAIRNFEI